MSDNLKQKTQKGLVWSFVERFSTQGIQFVFSVILARLLSPDDYGIIAMPLVFLSIGNGIQGLWSMVSGVPAGGRQYHPHRTPLDDGQMGAQEAMVVGVIPLSLGIRQQDAGFGFA